MNSSRQTALDEKILRQAMSGPHRRPSTGAGVWFALVAAIILVVLALSGCTTKAQLMSLDIAGRTSKLGRQLITEKCHSAKAECIKKLDAKCEKLQKCEADEKLVYAGDGTLQVMAETAAVMIKAGGDTRARGKLLFAEVLRRLEMIRNILKNWGVTL